MSNHLKSSLLAATAMFAVSGTQAHAGVVYPAADIHAAGATTVQDVLPREVNCITDTANKFALDASGNIAKSNSYSVNADKLVSARTLGNVDQFNGAIPYDCSTAKIQPNLTLHYLGTGSGTGRKMLRGTFKTVYDAITFSPVGSTATTFIGYPNSTIYGSTVSTWTGLHAAFSDAEASATSDIAPFNSAHSTAGAFIQIPLYVVPVALAYEPVYAKNPITKNNFTFNVANPVTVGNQTVGGLRLTKAAYCGIFNGYITNWNDSAIAEANYSALDKKKAPILVPLYDQTFDNATRWASEGAPIRLVGRLDGSGTTNIFTRHLAAVCGAALTKVPATSAASGKTNLFTAAKDYLPYDGTQDLRSFRFDTKIYLSSNSSYAQGDYAGSTNLIQGVVYAGEGSGTNQGFITGTGGTGETTTFTAGTKINGTGKFILASGGGNVANAIASFSTGTLNATYTNGTLLFNGKIGYLSADNVLPANTLNGLNLNSAALEVGETFTAKKKFWAVPNALTATAAFGDMLPPQTDKKGLFAAKGVKDASGNVLSRATPGNWADAMYVLGNGKVNKTTGLADPQAGYPFTGPSYMMTGTCFADPAVRNAMTAVLSTILSKNTVDASGNTLSANLFTGTVAPEVGIRANAGLAPMPAAWRTSIYNTFLTYDAKTVAGLSTKAAGVVLTKDKTATVSVATPATKVALFIQNGLPVDQTTADTLPTTATAKIDIAKKTLLYTGFNNSDPNPSCSAGAGL